MILALYRLLSPLAGRMLPLLAPFSPKLAALLRWRREAGSAATVAPGASPRWLVHASSAGELEQARPLLGEIRRRQPGAAILMTLSSTSARRASEQLRDADRVLPLPADTPRAMASLLRDFSPDFLLIVKWDLWPNLILEARRLRIPVFLVGAVLSSASGRNRWPGKRLYRPLHRGLAAVAAAWEEDAVRFRALGVPESRLAVTGDTRFDRVIARREEGRKHELMGGDSRPETCLVAGSSWPPEEKMLMDAFPRILADHPQTRLLLVPHEPDEENLVRLENEAADRGLAVARLSRLHALPAATVVLGDVLGRLAELYRLGSLALVGGGFGEGVHSVLEPAAHGLPVMMGPRIGRAPEAGGLIEAGGGWIVDDSEELERIWKRLLEDPDARGRASDRARRYVEAGAGSAPRSLDFLEKFQMEADNPAGLR